MKNLLQDNIDWLHRMQKVAKDNPPAFQIANPEKPRTARQSKVHEEKYLITKN